MVARSDVATGHQCHHPDRTDCERYQYENERLKGDRCSEKPPSGDSTSVDHGDQGVTAEPDRHGILGMTEQHDQVEEPDYHEETRDGSLPRAHCDPSAQRVDTENRDRVDRLMKYR